MQAGPQMRALIKRFKIDESGVITADWTALTGGMVLLGLAVLYAVMRSAEPLVEETNSTLTGMNIGVAIGDAPDFN